MKSLVTGMLAALFAGPLGKPADPDAAGKAITPGVRPRPWIPITVLKGPPGLLDLCDALRPEDRSAADGNEVARARARQEREMRRQDASSRSYAVDVPPSGYSFKEYDLPERRLILEAERGFRVADSIEVYVSDPESLFDFEIPAETAETLLKEHAARRLYLRLIFRPAKSELVGGCHRPSRAPSARMRVDVLAYDLVRLDGSVAARAETADFTDAAVTARPVSEPEVRAQRPTVEGGEATDELFAAARALAPAAVPCYRKALEARPGLRGTVVVGVWATTEGQIESPKMEVSSLDDDAVVACLVGKIAKARLAKLPRRTHVWLPFAFGSRGER